MYPHQSLVSLNEKINVANYMCTSDVRYTIYIEKILYCDMI